MSTLPEEVPLETIASTNTTLSVKAFPLLIKREDSRLLCYCQLADDGIRFERDGTSFGWVTIGTSNGVSIDPSNRHLWKYTSTIRGIASHKGHVKHLASATVEEDPTIGRLIASQAPDSKTKIPDAAVLAGIKRGVASYNTRVANSPLPDKDKPPLARPSGVFARVWNSGQDPITFKHSQTKKDLVNFLASARRVVSPQHLRDTFKDTDYRFGTIQQKDGEVIYRNSKGKPISSQTEFRQKMSIKKLELPFTKPTNFSLNRKSFNALADKTASSVIKPIKMWVDSIDDVEHYAIAAILALWKTILK